MTKIINRVHNTLTNKMVIVDEKYCNNNEEIELTVHKKSMFSEGDSFIVYDPNGDIIFRVDFYGLMKPHCLILLDNFGNPLLTLLPKRPTLHHRLEGYLGDKSEDQEPIMSIWKSSMIGRSGMLMVEVYDKTTHSTTEYNIDGCYKDRNCTVFEVQSDASRRHVAQIRRKVEPTRNTVLSRDVFSLTIQPGVDAAFAMGLVLALDHIDAHDVALPTSTI
ncbi:hypothetical protein RND81_06G211300 [Saponaria officinalis]|uniref:Uncharacterized protein n=1 Tax=Saponaria officinalis TaxID=3572 RepID=A0AAW1KE99_SAPOF